MAYQANDSTVLLHQALGYTGSVITGTIVDKNDLIGRRQGGERCERIGDQRLKVLSLVMAGEEERELLQWHLPQLPSRLHSANDSSDGPSTNRAGQPSHTCVDCCTWDSLAADHRIRGTPSRRWIRRRPELIPIVGIGAGDPWAMGFLHARNLCRLPPWLHVDPLGARIAWRTHHGQHRPRSTHQAPRNPCRRPAGTCYRATRCRPRRPTPRPTSCRRRHGVWTNDLARLGRMGPGRLRWNCGAPLLALGADPREDRAWSDPRRACGGVEAAVWHPDPHRCGACLRSRALGS